MEVCPQSLFLSHHWNVLMERLKILPALHPGLFAPRNIWISRSPASSGKAPWPPQRPRQRRGRPGEMLQLREGGTKCWKIPRERKGWHQELPLPVLTWMPPPASASPTSHKNTPENSEFGSFGGILTGFAESSNSPQC